MSEPIVQFLLRVPASVKQKIEDAAKENNRSTNAEALVRLEKSFEESLPNNDRAFTLAMHMLFSIIEANEKINMKLPDSIDDYITELIKATGYKAKNKTPE